MTFGRTPNATYGTFVAPVSSKFTGESNPHIHLVYRRRESSKNRDFSRNGKIFLKSRIYPGSALKGLGSHSFPIETGRWNRTKREDRLCTNCGVSGDEYHVIHRCVEINRNGIENIPLNWKDLWDYEHIYPVFTRIAKTNYLN